MFTSGKTNINYKYLKYKNKYIELKKKYNLLNYHKGGSTPIPTRLYFGPDDDDEVITPIDTPINRSLFPYDDNDNSNLVGTPTGTPILNNLVGTPTRNNNNNIYLTPTRNNNNNIYLTPTRTPNISSSSLFSGTPINNSQSNSLRSNQNTPQRSISDKTTSDTESTNTLKRQIKEIMKEINSKPKITKPSINIYYVKDKNHTYYDFNICNKMDDTTEIVLQSNFDKRIYKMCKNVNIFNTLYENKVNLLSGNKTEIVKPFFIFNNYETKTRDEGIDYGGLTKTVFLKLSELFISDNFDLFIYDSSVKINYLKIAENPSVEYLNRIEFLGSLFGIAINLELQIFVNLDPLLLYQMTHDNFNSLTPEEIKLIITNFDSELFNYTPYKCFDENEWNKDPYCQYNEEGKTLDISTRENDTILKIKNLYNSVITDAFVKGFRMYFNLLDKPPKLLDLLIVGERNESFEKILSMIEFKNFNPDQNTFMKSIITAHYNRSISQQEYKESLLTWITGTARLPIAGFPVDYPLQIRISDIIGKNTHNIHTCFNYIDINKELFDKMYMSMKQLNVDGVVNNLLYKIFSLSEIKKDIEVGFSRA